MAINFISLFDYWMWQNPGDTQYDLVYMHVQINVYFVKQFLFLTEGCFFANSVTEGYVFYEISIMEGFCCKKRITVDIYKKILKETIIFLYPKSGLFSTCVFFKVTFLPNFFTLHLMQGWLSKILSLIHYLSNTCKRLFTG